MFLSAELGQEKSRASHTAYKHSVHSPAPVPECGNIAVILLLMFSFIFSTTPFSLRVHLAVRQASILFASQLLNFLCSSKTICFNQNFGCLKTLPACHFPKHKALRLVFKRHIWTYSCALSMNMTKYVAQETDVT